MKRNTIQKQLIWKAVCDLCHPTAEEVYQNVKDSCPSISRATVYRNLAQLAKSGEIGTISTAESAERYDGKSAPHYHIHCTVCGQYFDCALPYMESLNCEAENCSGVQILLHQTIFEGVCPACRQRGAEKIR